MVKKREVLKYIASNIIKETVGATVNSVKTIGKFTYFAPSMIKNDPDGRLLFYFFGSVFGTLIHNLYYIPLTANLNSSDSHGLDIKYENGLLAAGCLIPVLTNTATLIHEWYKDKEEEYMAFKGSTGKKSGLETKVTEPEVSKPEIPKTNSPIDPQTYKNPFEIDIPEDKRLDNIVYLNQGGRN